MNGDIIVDLDNTVCNIEHRVHYVQDKKWDEFHERCQLDIPNPDVAHFCRQMVRAGSGLVAVTGRNERFRKLTVEWLVKWEIPIGDILMRPDYNYQPDHLLKPQMLSDHYGSWELVLENVWFAIDDRDKVVEAFRNNGLPCWQVRPGSY